MEVIEVSRAASPGRMIMGPVRAQRYLPFLRCLDVHFLELKHFCFQQLHQPGHLDRG
jgi:hypothetical protein